MPRLTIHVMTLFLVLAVAGCGGGSDGSDSADGGSSPASLAPQTAPVYLEMSLAPGVQKEFDGAWKGGGAPLKVENLV